MSYEYKVIPSPSQIDRAKRKLPAAERLAETLTAAINEMAQDGWEYLRSETMTVEDKKGRFSKVEEVIETVLVFRRAVTAANYAQRAPQQAVNVAQAAIEPASIRETSVQQPHVPQQRPRREPSIERATTDDGTSIDGNIPFVGGASR